ncbi:hypothetical protein M514_06610 [Trichuris suis]|uniref:Fibronectin type-III domain-containing protein n=1 Tax=Trichuris suis TaxID=68888 RepID=A0A085N2H9_9BILA|nr:hypothetical protein M513_06610 [Trichuris suis]KFD63675.1 hypothetical protein M514_06610 [Trichuris suis]KHJ40815.1 hypothetical protein D918_09099 [Trichuris suis]
MIDAIPWHRRHEEVALMRSTNFKWIRTTGLFHMLVVAVGASTLMHSISQQSSCAIAQFLDCLRNVSHHDDVGEHSVGRSKQCYSRLELLKREKASWCDESTSRRSVLSENLTEVALEDSPVAVRFLNAHELQIYFPVYSYVSFYVLETKEVGSCNGEWKNTGIFDNSTACYSLANACHTLEIKAFAVLSNGTLLFFVSKHKRHTVFPPEFLLTDLKSEELYFDAANDSVIAHYAWHHPLGYTGDDIRSYNVSIYTIHCTVVSAPQLHREMRYSADKAELIITLPSQAVLERCWFKISLQGQSVCPNTYTNVISTILKLKCYSVENYSCPLHGGYGYTSHCAVLSNFPFVEQKPKCLNRIDLIPSLHSEDGRVTSFDVCITWKQPRRCPIYLHLRWGVAEPVRLPTATYADMFQDRVAYRAPGLSHVYRWRIKDSDAVHKRLEPGLTNLTLQKLNLNQPYGFQLCAVYNLEFKKPSWHKVPLTPIRCTEQFNCQEPKVDWSVQSSGKDPVLAVGHSGSHETTKSKIRDIFSNFTQHSSKWTAEGVWVTLTWQLADKDMVDRIRDHHIKILNTDNCDGFDSNKHFALKESSSLEAIVMFSNKILERGCQLKAQIQTNLKDGALVTNTYPLQLPATSRRHESEPLQYKALANPICIEPVAKNSRSFNFTTSAVTIPLPDVMERLDQSLLNNKSLLFRWGYVEHSSEDFPLPYWFKEPVEWRLLEMNTSRVQIDLPRRGDIVGYEVSVVNHAFLATMNTSSSIPSCGITLLPTLWSEKSMSPLIESSASSRNVAFSMLVLTCVLISCHICSLIKHLSA